MSQQIGVFIKGLRELRRLSRTALAEKAGIDRQKLCRYEQGAQQPSYDDMRSLAEAFDTTVDDLYWMAGIAAQYAGGLSPDEAVSKFLDEMLPLCAWDLLPFRFLYDFYQAWNEKHQVCRQMMLQSEFRRAVLQYVQTCQDWQVRFGSRESPIFVHVAGRMDCPEPLVQEYNLTAWQDSSVFKTSYPGLERVEPRYKQRQEDVKMKNQEEAARLGRAIKALRQQKGLRQSELAARAGISGSAVCCYETGRKTPRPPHLVALTQAMNVTVDELFQLADKFDSET